MTGKPGGPDQLKGLKVSDHLYRFPRTALLVAKHRKKAIPRRKRWRLRHPEKDKAQKKGYYKRNKFNIVVKARKRFGREKKHKLTLTKAQRLAKSKGVD